MSTNIYHLIPNAGIFYVVFYICYNYTRLQVCLLSFLIPILCVCVCAISPSAQVATPLGRILYN